MHGCTFHTLHLFDTPASLATTVADFLAAGARAGETLLAVARLGNWPAVEAALEARGCSVTQLVGDRRLVVLEADDLLDEIGRTGVPKRERFDAGVGELATRLARGGRLRVYSELAEVCATRGQLEAAIRIEEFWNDLGERSTFDLLCGYLAAHFAAADGELDLRRVCAVHGHASARTEDPLSRWLLTFPTPAL